MLSTLYVHYTIFLVMFYNKIVKDFFGRGGDPLVFVCGLPWEFLVG